MEKSSLLVIIMIVAGVNSQLQKCVSPPTETCVWNDQPVTATDGEIANKFIEMSIERQQALELLGNGQNIKIWYDEDFIFANGEQIVDVGYTSQFHGRWFIEEHMHFELAKNKSEYARLVINVTVKNFRSEDHIRLNVVLHLANKTLKTTTYNWFIYYSNDPQTTPSPSSTPNFAINSTTNYTKADGENKEENEEDKSSNCRNTALLSTVIVLLLLLLVLVMSFSFWIRYKFNALHNIMKDWCMRVSQRDTDREQRQDADPSTHLPLSANVTTRLDDNA